eukprot:1087362-Amphidinium_carterae.1
MDRDLTGPRPEGDEEVVITADDELNEDVRDRLEIKGCAGVLVDGWGKQETRIFQTISALKQRPDFQPRVRRKVFHFYTKVIQELQLGDEAWHNAVWMLLRCLAACPALDASSDTCMAVVLLLRKNTTALLPVDVEWYVHKAQILSEVLSSDAGGVVEA